MKNAAHLAPKSRKSSKSRIAKAFVASAAIAAALVGGGAVCATTLAGASQSAAGQVAAQQQLAEKPAQQATQADVWNPAQSAADATVGAGLERFGAPAELYANGTRYGNPTYAYGGGVAQVTYEADGHTLVVRKASNQRSQALVALDTSALAQRWTANYEGIDVTLYGPEQGSAQIMEWGDGGADYGVTLKDATIGADDAAGIVKAIKEANAAPQTATNDEAKPAETQPAQAEAKPEQQAQPAQAEQQTQQATQQPNAKQNANPSNAVVDDAIWEAGLGEVTSTTLIQRADGTCYWEVTTRGSDGSIGTYYIDESGDMVNTVGKAEGAERQEVEDAVWQNGLGQYVYSVRCVDANGNEYWEVHSLGADGLEYVTNVDANGNAIG